MDPATTALISVVTAFGPAAIPWIGLYLVVKWVMGRSDADMEARVRLATALQELSSAIRDKIK